MFNPGWNEAAELCLSIGCPPCWIHRLDWREFPDGLRVSAGLLPVPHPRRWRWLEHIVTKTISLGSPLPFSRPNWNTDFFVNQPYSHYKLFFTANSSVSATYPIQAYLKFTDGSNLQVVNDSYAPNVGTGRQWDVRAVPGKTVNQVNFKIGASADQAATGFTYRISVQGCN